MPRPPSKRNWGNPPWRIDFASTAHELPAQVDYAVVGAGFSGLSAAAYLRRLQPERSVAVFEADRVGGGASGHTGGMALAETAAGDLPGLGDVLQGFSKIQQELEIECDFDLPGAWELGRNNVPKDSPVSWSDSGTLGVVRTVEGGTIDPGKLVSGYANAAQRMGALIFEGTPVESFSCGHPVEVLAGGKHLRAEQVLLATNAESLELSGLGREAEPKFTLALATEPLSEEQLRETGLASRQPFYTVDFPYLWGRPLGRNRMIFGSGLVHPKHWSEMLDLNVGEGQAAGLMRLLESRVRSLHPSLGKVRFTHHWGGPILIAEDMKPVFRRHPRSDKVLVLGAYSGHGVALSGYLGRWAAEVMTGKRKLPSWNP